jgi:hypothetical protein
MLNNNINYNLIQLIYLNFMDLDQKHTILNSKMEHFYSNVKEYQIKFYLKISLLISNLMDNQLYNELNLDVNILVLILQK